MNECTRPAPTLYDEAALGSEEKETMSKKSQFAAGLENLAH